MSESESKPTKDFIILDKQAWDDIKRYVVALSIDQQSKADYQLLLRLINEVDTEWPQWQ